MSERQRTDVNEEARWLMLWNLGILVGLVGLPAMLGFFAGHSIEVASKTPTLPWRLLFAALGAIVGAFAAWRTLTRRRA
jgi:NADH:ubiquinone oxidoreductase subunit 4 (subunit M)